MTVRVALRFGDSQSEEEGPGRALMQIPLHAKRFSILKFGHQARQGNLSEGAARPLTGLLTKRSRLMESRGSMIGVKDRSCDRAAAMRSVVLYANQRPISQLPCALRARQLAPKRVPNLFEFLIEALP